MIIYNFILPLPFLSLPVPFHDLLTALTILLTSARCCLLFFTFPWELHEVLRPQLLLRVGLQRAQALHPHTLPSATLQVRLPLPPCVIRSIKLRRGASAEVILAHTHTPHRYALQMLHIRGLIFAAISDEASPAIFFYLHPSAPSPRSRRSGRRE